MRLHLIGLPHTQLTEQYLSCAYTQKVYKFLDMMAGLHEVIYYGGEDVSEVRGVTEHVVCIKEEERSRWFPGGFDTSASAGAPKFEWDVSAPYWALLNER